MCSHSAAHTRHCLAENIHPSLSGENQNVSHFPDHSNHLIFPGQHFWTEGPGHWRWAEPTEQALQQTPQVLKHSHHQTLKGLQLLLSKSAFSRQEQTNMVSWKDFTTIYSHLSLVFWCFFAFKFLILLSELRYQEPAHYCAHSNNAAVGGHMPLNRVQQGSLKNTQVVLPFHWLVKACCPRLWSQETKTENKRNKC